MSSSGTNTRSVFDAFIGLLRRRLGVVLVCAILVPAAAVTYSATQTPEYKTTASLLFRDPGFDQKLFGSSYLPPSKDPAREEATNVTLVSLRAVASRTSKALGGTLSPDEVASQTSVAAAGRSDVIEITATHESKAFAARIANTFARQYILFRQSADRAKIRQAQALVRSQLDRLELESGSTDERRTLASRESQLEILAALQTGNAELVQAAQPPASPASPKPLRSGLIGLLVGLVMGILLAGFFDRRDRTLRQPEEIEEIFSRPLIGSVIDSQNLATRIAGPAPARESESFRLLRANLRYFNLQRELRTLLVTSAGPAEGKSTVAFHLGATYARAGDKTIVIEADLRNPGLPRGGLEDGDRRVGLGAVLVGEASFGDAVRSIPIGDSDQNGSGDLALDVLYADPVPPNPAELLETRQMQVLLQELKQAYDVVIIDTPPITIVSDAIPLISLADAVLVVARVGVTHRDGARELKTQLDNMSAYIPGVVLNGVEDGLFGYYGYSSPPASSVKAVQAGKR